MREVVRIQRNNMYHVTKLMIALCAIGGITLGGVFFKFANTSSGSEVKERIVSSVRAENMMEALFKIFNIDYYNPLTILNTGYPYFKSYYYDKYTEEMAQKEQEELEKAAIVDINEITQADDTTETVEKIDESTKVEPLQEVSSSIIFEGDAEESEQDPVVSSGKVQIVNKTKYSIDINKLLAEPLKLKADTKGPKILLYHTHTTEGFLKNISELNKKTLPSRTTDNKYNVVGVGEALISNLKKYNIDLLHDKTVYDKDYNKSYTESLKGITKNVEKNPSLKMAIDLHRDAVSGQKLRVVKQVNGKDVARIMFVIGTGSNLSNPQWKENLKLALKLQERLNEICPGLAKPIYVSPSVYNQHMMSGSLLVEIGGDGNVMDECIRSTAYLAQAINDVVFKKN